MKHGYPRVTLPILKIALMATILISFLIFSIANTIAQTEPVDEPVTEEMASESINESEATPLVTYSLPFTTGVSLCQIDLVFVADGSGSISASNFTQIKQFISAFVASINVNNQGTRTSLVQFSSQGRGKVQQTLTDDLSAVNTAINNMIQLRGQTDIQEGIQLASAELTARGRADTPRVIVVLTDGQHNQPGDPNSEASLFKSTGGFIFTIAVGSSVDRNELIGISSQPYTRYLYNVTDANSLSKILESLSQNVCNCRETQSTNERVTRVADGLCLRVINDNMYIGSANLANPNVRLKVTYEFADQSQGLFSKESLKGHVQSDSDLTVLSCLPAGVIPLLTGVKCLPSPTQYYFAINGTAHTADFTDPDRPSFDSILSLNGQLYRETGPGVLERPRASFFVFSGGSGIIHRSYITSVVTSPSYAIPATSQAPIEEYSQARDYVTQATANTNFAVGYRPAILDLTNNPPLRGEINDNAAFSQLTAIGVSADGKTIYLAATKENVGPQVLANKLAELGASRAILLDGSSSTQFASFRENYSSFFPSLSLARPVSSGVVAYSILTTVASSITLASTATPLVLSPNTTLNLRASGLPAGAVIYQVPVLLTSENTQQIDMSNSQSNSIWGNSTLEASTAISLPFPSSPLRHTGISYVVYAQNRTKQVIQPTASYTLKATYDLLDFPLGTTDCMMGIYFWNGTQWIREPTSKVDLSQRAVIAQPKQFGVWTIFADPGSSCLYLPLVRRR